MDIFFALLPWMFLAVLAWMVYLLIQQNGRILLHLDSLDERLAALGNQSGTPQPAPQPAPPPSLPIGSEAPGFELPDLDGKPRSLAEHRGRPTLLTFFNPHCGFCSQMAAKLGELPSDNGQGPALVIVTSGSADDNRAMVEDADLKCPVYLQKQGEVAALYRAGGTPMGYLIDAEGRIASPMTVGADALIALLRPTGVADPTNGSAAEGNGAAAKGGCGKCKSKKEPCGKVAPGSDEATDVKVAEVTADGLTLKPGGTVGSIGAALLARGAEATRMKVTYSSSDDTPGRDTELRALRRFVKGNPDWMVAEQPDPALGFIVLSRDPRDRKPLPSKFAMAANLAKAVAGHIGDGRRRLTAEQLEQRLEVCALCDRRTEDRCSACGCFLTTKAEWRSSDCPIGKWPALQQLSTVRVESSPEKALEGSGAPSSEVRAN